MVRSQRGFSFIELILAMVIAGIVASGLVLWVARPLEALQESHRRAAAVDQAERVGARLAAELPDALPNSVRVACAGRCLEFLPVVQHADYRADTPGDRLEFAVADDSFDVLLPLVAVPQAGQQVVINNQNASSTGSASAYSPEAGNNRATIVAGTTAAQLRIVSTQFPAPSPTQRFFIVDRPVSYFCQPAANGGAFRRYAGYAIQPAQPVNTGLGDVLSGGVLDCRFELAAPDIVALRLTVGDGQSSPLAFLSQIRLRHAP